jgi:hypothetical protein
MVGPQHDLLLQAVLEAPKQVAEVARYGVDNHRVAPVVR